MKTLLTLFLFLVLATSAHAARFVVEMPQTIVAPGSEFIAHVFVDTEGESLNAFEGQVLFPINLSEIKEVRDGSSIVTVWLDTPNSREAGRVVFSGITPGGYRGERGFLFSIVFKAKEEGVGLFSFSALQALKNDGSGTTALASGVSLEFSVSKKATSSALPEVLDTTPPEAFGVELIQNPDAFDGQKFLVFATQDKGVGLAGYEVCEGLFAACVSAESPYMLHNQAADSLITVKAIDNFGNARSAYLFTTSAKLRYALYAVLAILLCIGVLFVSVHVRRKY